MKLIHTVFETVGAPVLFVIFLSLLLVESRFELRKRVMPRWKRLITNFVLALPAFTLMRLLLLPSMVWLAYKNQTWHFGLNYLYDLPRWLELIVAFVLLDYGNYLWHRLNHVWPLLWRFHLVHHTDPDLDVATAIRFHFGEIITSVFFRGAIVFLIGVTPAMVLIYEIVFEAETQFHHSNWKLPFKLERALNKIIVTPRMHGIHHSVVKTETDSNYSVIFSVWDRMHKTVRLNIPQEEVVTGVPSYSNPEELTVKHLLKLPFTRIRKWDEMNERNSGDEGKLQP